MAARGASLNALMSKISSVVDPSGGIRSTQLLSGVTSNHTIQDRVMLEEQSIKMGIAQALLDNLAPAPDGLIVRDIFPDLDLRQDSDTAIARRDWYQPASGTWTSANVNTDTVVYLTNNNVSNQKKVYVFYGVRATNTGPADATTTIGISSITFQRGSQTRVVDTWDVEAIDVNQDRTLIAYTPVLFKANDNQRIAFRPSPKGSGTNDNIMLMGKVIERSGDTLTG